VHGLDWRTMLTRLSAVPVGKVAGQSLDRGAEGDLSTTSVAGQAGRGCADRGFRTPGQRTWPPCSDMDGHQRCPG
jgi:hypothetical protein